MKGRGRSDGTVGRIVFFCLFFFALCEADQVQFPASHMVGPLSLTRLTSECRARSSLSTAGYGPKTNKQTKGKGGTQELDGQVGLWEYWEYPLSVGQSLRGRSPNTGGHR